MRPSRWCVVAIVILFLVLAASYGVATPVFEASDEPFHYQYVHHLTTAYRLPLQDPAVIQPWRQEGSQPPLYYLMAAAATFWIDTSDLPERLVYNPHASVGIPLAPDNKNMAIHTPAERFPYRGTVLAVHLIRFLSTLMGAGTVFLAYRIVREVFPEALHLALMAAALVAFNPMFLFISASVNNDNLAVLLCSLALYQLVHLVRSGASVRGVAGLGIVTGLAALTKLSALGLIALAAVVLSWDAWRRRSLGVWLRHGFLAAGLVMAIAGWWYIRNWTLYRDPLGFNMWLAIAGTRPQVPSASGLLAEFQGFRISYWGLFGAVNVLMHRLAYLFYDSMTLLALAGLLLAGGQWVLRHRKARLWLSDLRSPNPQAVQAAVLALWPLILLVALVRWTRLTPASQGRLIFPGIAAVSLWLALGWNSLVPRRWRAAALGAMATAFFVLAAITPWVFIAPSYAVPPFLPHLPNTLQPLQIVYGESFELVGYYLPKHEVLPGGVLIVNLGWRALLPVEENYSVFVHLYGRDGEFLGQADTYPGGGLRPTSQWMAGDQLLDSVYVPVKPGVEAPAIGRIVVGLYHFPDMSMLGAKDPNGADLGTSPTIGRFKLAAVRPPAYEIPEGAEYLLGQKLALIGYDLSAAPAAVTLYWQAREPVVVDYTAFVHLLDASGQTVAQADGQPQEGQYPTSWWTAGEVVADRHVLPAEIIKGLPPGGYMLSVGLYNLATGQRLPVSAEGLPSSDQILLGPVAVP